MVKFQIIFWRDIPVMIRVRNGRIRHTRQLSDRFQKTVYRAAYRDKAINGDAYAQSWRTSDWQTRPGDVKKAEMMIVEELEQAYSDVYLEALARNKGFKEI